MRRQKEEKIQVHGASQQQKLLSVKAKGIAISIVYCVMYIATYHDIIAIQLATYICDRA